MDIFVHLRVHMNCMDCTTLMTDEEVEYLSIDGAGRCCKCEQAWSDRMDAWRTGKTIEPELDAIFSARRPSQEK